ncbi:sensor histidine kinase [Geosporobacter ferrireducens]|uniref:sensor histidine kinase n=1 Tax=Geosporobacter ferrireducens TaxID=1424294 RepID=UPI001A9A42CD|nr:HAMP domain-containing sensor histidine kinase [Geosporobacter ferrireducens]
MVKTSIKIKFSIFLGMLLLLTVFILSLLVLRGIESNQQAEYEDYLAQQAQRANIYFMQTILSEANKVPETFLATKGEQFAEALELISGQRLALYDNEGTLVSRKIAHMDSADIRRALGFALTNKTTYLVEGDSLYYLTPLKVGREQVGVVQFYYSLAGELRFYNRIRQLFINIGVGVFLLSFILAYFYFNSFANGIIQLQKMVEQIREGHFDTYVLSRKDEIGSLSQGIHGMSERIQKSIQNMEEEQKKLNLAINKLSLLDQQQKQFIGNVTHEFKTPLTSIKAYVDLLEMYPDDLELLEKAKADIKSETQRLYEMVEKVLQLSAMEKYDFEYNKEKLEIGQVIEGVINSLRGKIEKFGIELETDLKETYVEADKDSLAIILVNLLDNAIKYNHTRGYIHVKNYQKDNQVVVEIANTGMGIPEEAAQRIFEPFFTVDRNRSREKGGTGLGLSLVKRTVEGQGGSIALVKSDSKSTVFSVILPSVKTVE